MTEATTKATTDATTDAPEITTNPAAEPGPNPHTDVTSNGTSGVTSNSGRDTESVHNARIIELEQRLEQAYRRIEEGASKIDQALAAQRRRR